MLLLKVASGIEYLHTRSIVFRDLKCENILVWSFPLPNSPSSNCNVHVKLSDYGISQFASISGVLGLAGTPGFIAPEILKYNGKEVYTNKVVICVLYSVVKCTSNRISTCMLIPFLIKLSTYAP